MTMGRPWLLAVFGIGLIVRLIAFANLEIINPDGVLYIYQAKAIADGQWHLLNQCDLHFLSLYPLLIAAFQLVISNWVISAKLVSLCFGFGMLVILYLLLKNYFDATVTRLTLLLYAMLPVLVRYSIDAMRDATFWFFFAASIWLFTLQTRQNVKKSRDLYLIMGSSCLMIMAAWCRIEGLILMPVACLYIVAFERRKKWVRLLSFLLPPVCLVCLLGWMAASKGVDVFSFVRVNDVVDKFHAPFTAYQSLRMQLKAIGSQSHDGLLREFIPNARNTIWLIVLGTILRNAMESFFYPYVPVFIVGTVCTLRQRDRRRAFLFPLIIIGLSFLLLYMHVLQTWIMTYRFLILIIIPACVLAGVGMEKSVGFIGRTFNLSKAWSIAIIAIFIVGVSLVKNLSPIEHDKAVYREISATAKQSFHEDEVVGIAGRPSFIHQWIVFYANTTVPYPVCHHSFTVDANSMPELLAQMKSQGSVYLLWEASAWKDAKFGRNSSEFLDDFDPIGRWQHEDTGDLVLFRLKPAS